MKPNALRIAACLLFVLTPARPCSADTLPEVFSAEEKKLCSQLTLTNQPWASPRWEVSLTEARARATKENKPIFLVVNTGNVLGFV